MAKIIGKIRKPEGYHWYHLCKYTTDISDILVNGVSVGVVTSISGLSDEEAHQENVYHVEYRLKSNVITTDYAFQGLYMLEEVELYGITETSQYCFSGAGIKSLYIDSALTNLRNNTFISCPLEHIEMDSSNQKYVVDGECLIQKSNGFLHYGTSNAVIPDYVVSIGSYAFEGKSFETIVIPRSVKNLYSSLFRDSKLKYITIPDSVNYIWTSLFEGCQYLKYVNFGDEINHNFNFTYPLGSELFSGCYNLERINYYGDTLPEIRSNETSSYNNTFYGLTSNGILGVKEGVDTTPWFNGEYNLGTYDWTVGEIEIPNLHYTFTMKYNVDTTDEIYLFGPTNTSFGDYFHTLEGFDVWVETMYIDGVDVGVTPTYAFDTIGEHDVVLVTAGYNLPNNLFYHNEYLTSFTFPDEHILIVNSSVFQGCKNLQTVVLPEKLVTINVGAFQSCTSLTEITFPSNVEDIKYDSFAGCTSLMTITSKATTAPQIATSSMYHTFSVPKYGTLYYPAGADYSTWLNKTDKVYNLGHYEWNGVEVHPNGEILTPNGTKAIGVNGQTFQYNIKTNNIQYILSYYITDNYGNMYLDTIDGFISMEMVDMNNFNITVEENEGDERRCSIYFQYGDYNGNQLTHTLTIKQDAKPEEEPDEPTEPDVPPTPDEPEIPEVVPDPTIVVSKNQMTFDNVGDSNTVQVTYINVSNIVPPTVGEGFTIEEIERIESEEGIQVKYKITRVSPKRQNASINFQGTNSEGKTTTSKDVTLKGEPVPAEVRYSCYDMEKGVIIFEATGDTAEVNIYAEGVNPPYEFSYEIDGNGITCTFNELNWDSGDGDIYWRYKFTSAANNGNKPYTGTITFNYKDELTNKTIELPFYVRYANEGKIEAGSTRYEYDKDGKSTFTLNGGDFSISYFNMATINTPEVDGDWIIVGEGVRDTGTYVDERDKYRYSITVSPNSGSERRCTVTFSGKGIDGKDYSLEIEVKQEGTNTVKPIDEGFIELQQLSVELLADGGAQTFQVKYYDARTIYEPILEFDWATITEVSRSEPQPDVAWNGEECDSVYVTYKVTAKPTESGRQMRVKFKSDINYYDGGVVHMEKDKFIIYQLAEGSTEVQGSVSILRYSKEYTYYGSPMGWNFRVGYSDVTPDTPIISESWCRVGEVKDLKADEYDYYKEYVLEVDTNNSTLSRTCTITFIGNAQDGTQIKTPFQFTQQGQEEIVNEGEYDNYKGYFMDFEGAVHSVSFITNPRSEAFGDIRLAGESPVVVSYTENSELFEPIRTSTCTVKVLSSHYLMNLYTGKAQGTQVILKNEDRGIIEWCGFLQPNLYNQGFSNCVEEIEFEASDCLSSLQYLKYEYYYNGNGQPMIVSFKDIIDTIADKCSLINDYRFTQKLFSNSDESKIFDFKEFYISENNFYSEEGEPWTYQEVLEETCKYFGYVCFQWGDKLYFIDYDKYQSNNSMVGYKYSKEDRWSKRGYITISTSNRITEKKYRGTGADISLDDIFNKVSVNCNYYNVEHVIPDLFEDDNLTERNTLSITGVVNRGQEIGYRTDYIVYDHKNIISHFYKPIIGTSVHETKVTPTEDDFKKKSFFKDFVGANIVDMYHLGYSDLKGTTYESKEWEKYLMISQLNRPWCKGYVQNDVVYWEDYNLPIMEFTQLPQIFIDNHKEVYTSNTTTGGRVPSTRAGIGSSSSTSRNDRNTTTINVNKSEHFLVIRAEAAFTPDFSESYVPEGVEQTAFGKWSNNQYGGYTYLPIKDTSSKNYSFNPKLTFYLEIPSAGWWDGSKWVDYETYFEVPLEALHYTNEIWYTFKNTQNKVETNLFLGKAGYKIQLPESMESTAFMQFKIGMPKRFAQLYASDGGDDTGKAGNAYCFIKNLEMDIVSRNTALMKDEDIVYENVIDDNNVVGPLEIDLKITSDNNITYSFSTVSTKYGEDMINTTNFRFYDLEGELILPEEAIINRYVNQYSTPTLKENVTVDMSFTPAQMITDTYWDKDFVIVGQEIDYQMCRQEITLLEKK